MELAIVKFLNRNFRFLNPATKFISHIPFLVIFWSALTLSLATLLGGRNGLELIAAYCISLAIHFLVIKKITDRFVARRKRPFEVWPEEIIPIGQLQGASSFPSGHTLAMTAIATVYSSLITGIWPFMLAMVIIIALARLHNGMHYPSDVLGGAVFGFIYGIIGLFAANYVISVIG